MTQRTTRFLALVSFAIILGGCISSQPRYFAQGRTEQDLLKARLQCFGDVQKQRGIKAGENSPSIPECGPINACLAAKGYLPSDQGNLTLPKGATLVCTE